MLSSHLNSEQLHHAYAFIGDRVRILESLFSFIENDLSFRRESNPDFWMKEIDTFGIDDARELSELHLKKPFGDGKKIFVLAVGSLTLEAQNALLKLFEEPHAGNHFFLIIPEEGILIPTLRSRMMLISSQSEKTSSLKVGKEFLKSTLPDRLSIIKGIAEEKDKTAAKALICSLQTVLHSTKEADLARNAGILTDLLKAESYLSDRSPSVKMILEHIAHTLPLQD